MKKIYGFAFAAAVMALASCSNDNEPVNNPNPTPAPAGPGSYVAVNICNPANTRAEGYQVGTKNENTVSSGTFYIFKDSELAFVQPINENASWQGPLDMGNTVEVIGGATLLIPGEITGELTEVTAPDVPTGLEVLVVLNDNNAGVELSRGMSMDECLAKLSAEGENEDKAATPLNFLMSNSTYFSEVTNNTNNGTKVIAVPLTRTNLVATEAEAMRHPVNIYVERTVARVDYKKAEPTDGEEWLRNNTIHYQNAQEVTTITPNILGVKVVSDPTNSSLFKQFDASQIDSNWSTLADLNDAGNFRSFWATMPTEGINKPTFSYASMNGANFDPADWANNETKTMYLHENTDANDPSTVVVYAQLMKDNQPFEIAALYGQYTDKEGAINMVANTVRGLGYRIETIVKENGEEVRREYRTINPSDLDWSNEVYMPAEGVQESGNRTYLNFVAELGEDESIVKVNGTDYDRSETLAAELDKFLADTPISVWEDGYCYYYTTIDHIDKVGKKIAGVVRNHLYQINFTGLSGLGTPVFDPDKDVVPVKPKYDEGDNVYLAAQINVLQWRVASQNTILGE